MRKLLKPLGKILLLLLAIPVLFYLFLVLRNLRDDELDPEVAKLLAHSPTQIAAAGNGYFAWIGVVGPEGQDPHAWGSRWVQEAMAADKRPNEPNSPNPPINAEKRPAELKNEALACYQAENCLAEVARNPAQAREVLETGRITLERGDKAVAYGAYQEVWRLDESWASQLPQHPVLWRPLSNTRFALLVAEGKHEAALDRLGREITFYGRQLQGSHSMISKLVALANLKADYRLLGQYLLAYPVQAKAAGERLQSMLAPLPKEALSLQPALLAELRQAARLILAMEKVPDGNAQLLYVAGNEGLPGYFGNALAAPLLQYKATVNEHARYLRRWLAIEGLSDAAYRQALAAEASPREQGYLDMFQARNPLGHLLNLVAEVDYSPYFFKRDDTLAVHAATVFQLELLRRGSMDAEAIGQAVAASPSLVHPFSGEKPVWDGARRSLTYAAARDRQGKPLVLLF